MTKAPADHGLGKPTQPPPDAGAAALAIPVTPERQAELASRISKTSTDWLTELSALQRADIEFAARLAGCTKPADAAALCSEWMSRRIDAAVGMHGRLLELWLGTVSSFTPPGR